jgi:mono/diheme cytochrome c family protein
LQKAARIKSEGAPGGRLSVSRNPMRFAGRALALAFAVACVLQTMTACGKKQPQTGDPKVNTGRGVYLARCIACHSSNPAMDGSLGPAVKGSSLELLQARVLRGEYPAGYTPKRASKIMVKLPLTEEDVANLHAYLNAP